MAQESWKREEEAGCQLPEGPVLCTNNCGFFGSVTTMNLCSKCYREHILKQSKPIDMSSIKPVCKDPTSVLPVLEDPSSVLPEKVENSTEKEEIASGSGIPGDSGEKKVPNRCFTCRKRVGLTGFKCRCGDVFCSMHRYSDKHDCSFDYKAAGREAIAKANPVVKADKIEKI